MATIHLTADAYATLEGAVARITYVSEESQYVVARLDVAGRPDPVTIVGTVLSLTPGETLRVHGRWSHHPKFGEQFRVDRYEPIVPATITGIQKYLGSGMIKGIGPVFAKGRNYVEGSRYPPAPVLYSTLSLSILIAALVIYAWRAHSGHAAILGSAPACRDQGYANANDCPSPRSSARR